MLTAYYGNGWPLKLGVLTSKIQERDCYNYVWDREGGGGMRPSASQAPAMSDASV